jgi:alpha-1,2-mannosyltransferase
MSAASFVTLGYREVRTQAMLAAVLLWSAAGVTTFCSPGDRALTGRLKGGDFIEFYTLGHIAYGRDYPRLDRSDALHDLQVQLLPASAPELYLPVYPPQTALLFAPFALLSFHAALALWTVILIATYAAIVWRTWQPISAALPDAAFVFAAAACFPPFWSLVLHAQTTVVPLLAFFLCGWALHKDRRFSAGMALGLLAIKPQFALVLGVVALLGREWRMMLGAASAIALQVAAVLIVLGPEAWVVYAQNLRGMPRVEALLEPQPWQMHSLRTIANLLPGPLALGTWVFLTAVVAYLAASVWRMAAALPLRLGTLVVASVLANPHLIVYDATVLALPLLWIGGWVEQHKPAGRLRFWTVVYALFVLLLLPTARVLYVQGSVLAMLSIFRMAVRYSRESRVPVQAW